MYVRGTAVKTAPEKLNATIANFEQAVVPGLRKLPGYLGATLSVDRQTGEGIAVTIWESLAAMNAAEQAATQARRQSAEATGGQIVDVDRFEVTAMHRAPGATPGPGFARLNSFYGDLDKIPGSVEFVTSKVIPLVSQQKGFRSLISGVNRMTGRAFLTTSWATAADRDATESGVSATRQEAARVAGAEHLEVRPLEIVFSEVKQEALTG